MDGIVAGIDYGTVRVGIAVSDVGRTFSMPLETYTRNTQSHDGTFFRQLVKRERISLFVVGLPVHLDGRIGEKAAEAMEFGTWLTETTGVAVEYVDERFSSCEADDLLRQSDFSRKKKRDRRDKLAAQILLTTFLESGSLSLHDIRAIDQ